MTEVVDMDATDEQGRTGEVSRDGLDGAPVPKDHGDPAAEYRAAVTASALFDRSFRQVLRVTGRAPAQMLSGLATGRIPPDQEGVEPTESNLDESGLLRGWVPYSLILTPKGRIVAELRVGRLESGDDGALFLDFPPEAVESARAHMAKYLPPRFAKVQPFESPPGMLTLVGPDAGEQLRREVLGMDGPDPDALEEGQELVRADGSPLGLRVIRCGDVAQPAFDLLADRETLTSLRDRLVERGVRPAGSSAWEVLRIEKGRPAFGREFDEKTLPPEAGLDNRAIDHAKGCYTGQEVIVRIRDRGKVNRQLCGLLLGDVDPPEPGTPIFHPDRDRSSGEIRSAVRSPAFEQTIALAYVRREVEPGRAVQIGEMEGPRAEVRALGVDGWR